MYSYKSCFLYSFTCLLILALTCLFWEFFLFLFFCIGDFLYKGYFLLFFLNYLGVCGDSKLLEKTLPCTESVSTFALGHILNLDLR